MDAARGHDRSALIQVLLACMLVWALVAPARSATKRFFCSRSMIFLGTYSYGLYVYHHLISYYFSTNRTELGLARWLGSHGLAVALQATVGMAASLVLAYLSYELIEKRFLKLKRFFENSDTLGVFGAKVWGRGTAVLQGRSQTQILL